MPDLTITLTAGQAARVAHALGVIRNLGRDATLGEAKTEVVQYLRGLVEQVEIQEARAALTPPTTFEPT